MVETMKLPEPRLAEMDTTKKWTLDYDKDVDVLQIHIGKPRPAVSVPLSDLWIRIDPATGEVVGIEVEDFKSVFIPKHPDFPVGVAHGRQKVKQGTREAKGDWLQALIDFLKRLRDGSSHGGHPLLA